MLFSSNVFAVSIKNIIQIFLKYTNRRVIVTSGVSRKCGCCFQDPFITKDEEPGTYRPYELGQEMGVWINNSDGVTPAVGQVGFLIL